MLEDIYRTITELIRRSFDESIAVRTCLLMNKLKLRKRLIRNLLKYNDLLFEPLSEKLLEPTNPKVVLNF